MFLLKLILILFITLIVLVIVSTAMKLSLLITRRHNYTNQLLLLPSFLSIIVWGLAFIFLYFIVLKITSQNLEQLLFITLMDPTTMIKTPKLIPIFSVTTLVAILLQALTYYTININYEKIWGYLRFRLKQIFHIQSKENNMTIPKETYHVPFHMAIIASFLTTSITFILIFLLYRFGYSISDSILSKL